MRCLRAFPTAAEPTARETGYECPLWGLDQARRRHAGTADRPLVLQLQASCRTAANRRFGEGFRMPARRDLSTRAEGRRPKASQEGTRGARRAVCRLWGFDEAAAWVGDALAGVVGSGSTTAVVSLAPRRRSAGRCWPDRRHRACRWRRRGQQRRDGGSEVPRRPGGAMRR
jgi:hypothetical protein